MAINSQAYQNQVAIDVFGSGLLGGLGGQLGGFAQQNTGVWSERDDTLYISTGTANMDTTLTDWVNLTTVQAKANPVAPKDIGLLWLEGRVNEITDMGQALL